MTPRTPDDASGPREYDPEEVDALTTKAAQLLEELHEVMAEMSDRLRGVGAEPE